MPSSGTLTRTASPATIFQGFDTFSGLPRSTAVEGTTLVNDSGQRCDYTVCESIESLYQALNISAGVAANFRLGGLDAKSEFAASLNTSSTSIVIAIYANKVMGTTKYLHAVPKQGIKAPSSAPEVEMFYQAYGDSFVDTITTGAEYIAAYVFYCQSVEERISVMTELRAKGISLHGQVSAGLHASIEQVRSTQEVRSGFSQQVFGFSDLPLPTPDKMVEFALNFATHHPDAPTVLSFGTSGYEHVPGMGDAWSQVRENRDQFLDRADGQGVNQQASALISLRNQIQWIREIYDLYNYQGDSELRDRRHEVDRQIGELSDAIDQLAKDPTQPYQAPSLPSLTWGTPVLNFDGPDEPDAWGGHGGSEFRDVTRESVMSGRILRKITPCGGSWVDAITSSFGDGHTVRHGGDGGHDAPSLVLGAHEYVTELRGRSGGWIDQLEVVSSAGQRTGTGGDGGSPFSWTVPDGSVFVGFAGRSGFWIDQIGPLIITFRPARWEELPSR